MKNILSELPVLKTNRYYSTQELSKLLHANESTVKRWADSGKLKCFKTPGGHRKYTPDHVSEFIANYHYEIISFDVDFSQREEKELLEFLISKEDYRTLSEVYFSLSSKAEKENLFAILRSCHSAGIPLITVYDEIVTKAVKKIFNLRNQSKITLVEELIAKNSILESLLQFRLLSQKIIFTKKVVVLSAATNGIQEVVLTCAEHLLTMAGWKVLNLGTNTHLDVLIDVINTNAPNLICLCKDYQLQNSHEMLKKLQPSISNIGSQLLFSNFDSSAKNIASLQSVEIELISFSSFKEMFSLILNKH